MDKYKKKIGHFVWVIYKNGSGVMGEVLSVKKIEDSKEEDPYFQFLLQAGTYYVEVDARELIDVYDLTNIYGQKQEYKLEDFGMNSSLEDNEIMDEIIKSWDSYEENEKKNLSYLIRFKMDEKVIAGFMDKISALIHENERLKHDIKRMSSPRLIGESLLGSLISLHSSNGEGED